MDGVVYGSAGGFGFATGLSFTREILIPTEATVMATGSAVGYGEMALVGVSDGVFGALIGVGFAAAVETRTPLMRAVAALVGLAGAALAHLLYDFVAAGDPFGDAAVMRKWVGLTLPVVGIAIVSIVALRAENRAIAEELQGEAETGAVTNDELRVLQSLMARELLYVGKLIRADVGGWSTLHRLHNRQVQLALAKRRASEERDAERRKAMAAEVAHLRVAVFDLKRSLGVPTPNARKAAGGEG